MSDLLILPIATPLAAAAISLLAWGNVRVQQAIAVLGSTIMLAGAVLILRSAARDGIQVLEVGNWPAPMGIVLVADVFSGMMLCLAAIIGLAVVIYSLTSMDRERSQYGYYPLLLVLLGGVSGAFLTGDFFNLYVWFEVMLMSSFVLMAMGGGRMQMESALKYVTLNFLSSVFFLTNLGLLYAAAGTLNFADLALSLQEAENPGLITTLAVLFLVSFGVKAAMFPVFFWLPASYHTPPAAISAVFAGLLTKVGVYAIIRVFTLLFLDDAHFTHTLIIVVSGLTMITGVLGAVAQNEFRRILSFHIISQIGYMTMGLGIFTPLGLAGSIFYITHHIIVKTNLFLISGLVHRLRGTYQLGLLGGMHANALVAGLFIVPAMSLAGIPPFSGFFAKLTLVRAGFEADQYVIVAVSLVVGLLTLFSMSKIWNEVFAKSAAHEPVGREHLSGFEIFPCIALAVLTICIGLGAGPVLDLSTQAADQLLDPGNYTRAVLGEDAS